MGVLVPFLREGGVMRAGPTGSLALLVWVKRREDEVGERRISVHNEARETTSARAIGPPASGK